LKFYEHMLELMNQHNYKVADVSKGTGIAYTTIDSIIKKEIDKKISLNNALKIAKFFGVKVESMINCNSNEVSLSPTEKKVILAYRKKKQAQEYVHRVLEIEFGEELSKKEFIGEM